GEAGSGDGGAGADRGGGAGAAAGGGPSPPAEADGDPEPADARRGDDGEEGAQAETEAGHGELAEPVSTAAAEAREAVALRATADRDGIVGGGEEALRPSADTHARSGDGRSRVG